MPLRLRFFFSVLTGALLLIPALALYRELSQRSDIWWTPPLMALSLAESQDRVQIYVRGKPLGPLLAARQLLVANEPGSSPVGADDIGLRFNNWDRVRAARIPTPAGLRGMLRWRTCALSTDCIGTTRLSGRECIGCCLTSA